MAVYERTIYLSPEDTEELRYVMKLDGAAGLDCDYDKSFTAEYEGDIIGCVSIIPPLERKRGIRPKSGFILWKGEEDIEGLEPVIDDHLFGIHTINFNEDVYCLRILPADIPGAELR